MSWGERSCKLFGRCTRNPEMWECNVDCEEYEWDGKTNPDSTPGESRKGPELIRQALNAKRKKKRKKGKRKRR